MTTPFDSSPPQFPLGWNRSELGWLATSDWLAETFPSFDRRATALIERVAALFDAQERGLRDASAALLADVWGGPEGAMVALHDRMHAMPSISSLGIGALHLVVATLASLRGPKPEPPVPAAVRCCGWTTLPPELGEIVVDLTIALPRWYDVQMHAIPRRSAARATDLDDADISELDRDIEDYLETPGEGFRREARHEDDDPHDSRAAQRGMVRHLARVAAALAEVTGSTAAAWSPAATSADWSAPGSTARFSTLGTITRRHDYFLSVMQIVDHHAAYTLPLYEAYADTCDQTHWQHVEHAALALARSISAHAAGETVLRAATRRFLVGDLPGCRALAEQAFAALEAAGAREEAWFAAALVARTSAIDDPLATRAWLTTAQALTDPNRIAARLGIAVDLAAVCESTGDEIGRRRASAEIERIRLDMQPERIADLVDDCGRPIDGGVARSFGRATFDHVAELLAKGEIESAYAVFSEEVGDLVETMPLQTVVDRLRGALAVVQTAPSPHPHSATHAPQVAATIGGWICGAIADLIVDPGRDDEWQEARRLQFELEDEPWAVPELLAGEGWYELRAFTAVLERTLGQAVTVYRSICARACAPRCLAEADRELAEGRTRRARVWTERAAVLRQRT